MLYGMYVSAAGALANDYRQDVVANNLANAETVSFKRDLALFQARRTRSAQNGQARFTTAMLEGIGGGIFALPTHTDFKPASAEKTDRPYDLALTQPGFFQVRKADEINYTRDGRLAIHKDTSQLVTMAGSLPVLDDAGSTILLDNNLGFHVDEAGNISQDGQVVARLGVVDFQDRNALAKQGDNLYVAQDNQASHPVEYLPAQVLQSLLFSERLPLLPAFVSPLVHLPWLV